MNTSGSTPHRTTLTLSRAHSPHSLTITFRLNSDTVTVKRAAATFAASIDAVRKGGENLAAHVEMVRKYGVPVVVAINAFPGDADSEFEAIREEFLEECYPARFSHFRKTFGYANAPMDGMWLRAPYLHNGSVPTLWDLLQPASKRPKTFWRGNDRYDPVRLGFVADVAEENGRRFFRFDTAVAGNGNMGHEGERYGTQLSDGEKWDLIEYLKTF